MYMCVSVCVYVCICIYIVHACKLPIYIMLTWKSTFEFDYLVTCVHVHISIYLFKCKNICYSLIDLNMCIAMCIIMYVCICVIMYVCICVIMYVCICVIMYVCIYV